MKTCSKCVIEKDVSEFCKDKTHLDGLQTQCKECRKIANKIYYQRNLEKRKATKTRYRKTLGGYIRSIYYAMKRRCNNLNCENYKHYGGRGIKCLFESVDEFVDYVINVLRVDPRGLQIDRINNDGHYEPGNIRFVTAKENSNNRRRLVKIGR